MIVNEGCRDASFSYAHKVAGCDDINTTAGIGKVGEHGAHKVASRTGRWGVYVSVK